MCDFKKFKNFRFHRFHKLFHAFFYFNISAFVKFLYEFLKPFNNSTVSMKKVIKWYLNFYTNASVDSFASNNNTTVMARKF